MTEGSLQELEDLAKTHPNAEIRKVVSEAVIEVRNLRIEAKHHAVSSAIRDGGIIGFGIIWLLDILLKTFGFTPPFQVMYIAALVFGIGGGIRGWWKARKA